MNREEFDDEYYQQKMMEHRIRMEKRREKRKKEKRLHILLFFLLLLLLFLAFIGVRYALPYVQQQGGISFGKLCVLYILPFNSMFCKKSRGGVFSPERMALLIFANPPTPAI